MECMKIEPQKEHQWLTRLVGEWEFEHEMVMEPGKPPVKFTGTESVRSLGGVWIVCEGRCEVPGSETGLTVMTLGFDPARGKFVGSFIASMMTHFWIYEGSLDAAGKVLTLDAVGPVFSPDGPPDGKMAQYQDIIEVEGDGHRVLRSQILGPDGTWTRFMTAHYRRTK